MCVVLLGIFELCVAWKLNDPRVGFQRSGSWEVLPFATFLQADDEEGATVGSLNRGRGVLKKAEGIPFL